MARIKVYCPQCERANKEDSRTCLNCGYQLALVQLGGEEGRAKVSMWKWWTTTTCTARIGACCVGGFALFFVVCSWLILMDSKSTSRATAASPAAKRALSMGDGYDWERLSTKERVEVGILCEERVGKLKNDWTYMGFIDTFYHKARTDLRLFNANRELLKRSISGLCEAAAKVDKLFWDNNWLISD